jgi:hypothetical protein
MEIDYDKKPYTLIQLPNNDELQIIPNGDDGKTFWLFQIYGPGNGSGNRREWRYPLDLLAVECIKIELLKNPLSNITPDGELQS